MDLWVVVVPTASPSGMVKLEVPATNGDSKEQQARVYEMRVVHEGTEPLRTWL